MSITFLPPRAALSPAVARLRARHGEIYAIVSPPRCSSTAFARVFWQHPRIGFYCHEPFEVTYYEDAGVESVLERLERPLDLSALGAVAERGPAAARGRALALKEMPYQVGKRFTLLAELASAPIVFLMRDPRLNIASRMAKKREAGESPFFPAVETGWELLARQIGWCRAEGIDHLLVDSTDFRNRPGDVFPRVFERLGLDFDPAMLTWTPCPEVELDNLGGKHSHLYGKVLASSGLKPDLEPVPDLESFPVDGGWRDHVARCLEIYEELSALDRRIRPTG